MRQLNPTNFLKLTSYHNHVMAINMFKRPGRWIRGSGRSGSMLIEIELGRNTLDFRKPGNIQDVIMPRFLYISKIRRILWKR